MDGKCKRLRFVQTSLFAWRSVIFRLKPVNLNCLPFNDLINLVLMILWNRGYRPAAHSLQSVKPLH